MTIGTYRGGVLVPGRMTTCAGSGRMRTGQRERRSVVIKSSFTGSGRMTCITGRAVICIAAHTAVFVVCFSFIIMRMAIDAGVLCIVCRVCMAIGTLVPDRLIMFP